MLLAADGASFPGASAGYHDFSHFIRDSNRFIGATPRRFLAIEMPYSRAVLRSRMLVTSLATPLGNPSQKLRSSPPASRMSTRERQAALSRSARTQSVAPDPTMIPS
jgi:hypothetical protein